MDSDCLVPDLCTLVTFRTCQTNVHCLANAIHVKECWDFFKVLRL